MDAPSPTAGVSSTPPAPQARPEATPLTAPTVASVVQAPAWPRSAQWATAGLLVLALGLLGWQAWNAQRWGSRPTDLGTDADPAGRIDLNHADQAQLRQLPGVGEKTAERIEAYRLAHNGFQNVEELRQVHGVGPALLGRLRPLLEVTPYEVVEDGAEVSSPTPASLQFAAPKGVAPPVPRIAAVSRKKVENLTEPIDVNHATVEELQRLPGIGPTLSGASSRCASGNRSVRWTSCAGCPALGQRRWSGCGRS